MMAGRISTELIDNIHHELEKDDSLLSGTKIFDQSFNERTEAIQAMNRVYKTESRETFCNYLKEKLHIDTGFNPTSSNNEKKRKKECHQKLKTKEVPVSSDDDDDIDINELETKSYETLFEGDEELISVLKEMERKYDEKEREAVKYGTLGKTIYLQIKYREQIFKTWIKMNIDFSGVFYEIAKKFKADIRCIMILHSKRIIAIEDTPMKLGIKETDVIDCLIFYSWVMNPTNKQNCLNIQIQEENGQIATFQIHKLEKFQHIMEKFCAEKKVPVDDSFFKLKGKQIFPNQTPYKLNLESESILHFQMP